MKQADIKMLLRPGTDGALACGVMHVLFRDGYADRAYLERYTDCPTSSKRICDPHAGMGVAITGCAGRDHRGVRPLVGQTKRAFFRLGYGFTRSRNGAAQHACGAVHPAVTGAWQYEGGGAFHNNYAIYHWNKNPSSRATTRSTAPSRVLDQSRSAHPDRRCRGADQGGPPVKAMLIQNTNPMSVAPEQDAGARGFAREDLFVCVHEQFMTETAQMADIVLPATMFMEHDDLYQGGGHQHIRSAPS
jgi:anaerobic selenocysteine-containing dehydrogenase